MGERRARHVSRTPFHPALVVEWFWRQHGQGASRVVKTSADGLHQECEFLPWVSEMAAQLSDCEFAAVGTVEHWASTPFHGRPEAAGILLRDGYTPGRGPHHEQSLAARQRARRRYRASLPPDERRRFEAAISASAGRTRRFDRVGELCYQLRREAGLNAGEIADLLNAFAFEGERFAPAHRENAVARVQRRIDRIRKRHRASPPTVTNGGTHGPSNSLPGGKLATKQVPE